MSVAIFKKNLPISILFDFLEENECDQEEDTFHITKEFYKKTTMHEKLKDFLEIIQVYYYKSKQFYTTRDMTYSRFLTIVRQICNYHKVEIINQIHYSKSKHEISYKIKREIA